MNLTEWIDANRSIFTQLSQQVWQYAELGYHEEQSAQTLSDALEEAGFRVERGVAGIPTAFVASYGRAGGPVIGILGEFDALPGLSQDSVPYQKPLQSGAPGHGCGHNLLGSAGVASVMALKQALDEGQAQGLIRYYGCPAEEGGAGKAFMAKAGLFDDLDICLTWHPDAFNVVGWGNFLANYRVGFKFHGKTAHAAADPYNGRSALDAVELMNVGVNYLREHMIPGARIHYVITNGGKAPNVVPDEAASHYSVRAPRTDQLDALYSRVLDIARGAALMTGTQMEVVFYAGMSNMLLNETINHVLQEKLEAVGAPQFDAQEQEFARQIAATIPEGSLEEAAAAYSVSEKMLAALKDRLLCESILPPYRADVIMPGSTDVGDVSWAAPTGQVMTTCMALGTPFHTWQVVAQGSMSIGHKGMLYAAKVMALSALEFMQNPALLQQAKDEFKAKRAAVRYVSPIPDGAKPPINL